MSNITKTTTLTEAYPRLSQTADKNQIKEQIVQINKDTKRGYKIILDGEVYTDGQKLHKALLSKEARGEIDKSTTFKFLRLSHQGLFAPITNQGMQIANSYSTLDKVCQWKQQQNDPKSKTADPVKIFLSTTNGKATISSVVESLVATPDLESEDFSDIVVARFKASTIVDLTTNTVSVSHQPLDAEKLSLDIPTRVSLSSASSPSQTSPSSSSDGSPPPIRSAYTRLTIAERARLSPLVSSFITL